MKHIFSLIGVAFLTFIFTFYVDGEMGAILIAFLLFAVGFSFALTLISRKRIRVSFDCNAYVKCGSELEVTVTVEKEGKLPIALVQVSVGATSVFENVGKVYRMSFLTDERAEFTLKIPAKIGGNGEVYINRVYSSGFLGFFRLKAATELPKPKSVGVIPEIPEVSASSALFRDIADVVLTTENDEENDTSMLFSANTAPGYEHREYVQGDSLKRVNWKLSSKTSKLMVRLDEAASSVQPSIVLDLYRNSEKNVLYSLKQEEKLIQSVFGLINLLIRQGIACTFVYRSYNGTVVSENVDNPDYPSQLLLKVLAAKVECDKRIRLDLSAVNACTCVAATTDVSGSFDEIVSIIPDKDNACAIVPDADIASGTTLPVWYLAEDNNFRMV